VLSGVSVMSLAFGVSAGVGADLSGGVVAIVAAGGAAVWAVSALRRAQHIAPSRRTG